MNRRRTLRAHWVVGVYLASGLTTAFAMLGDAPYVSFAPSRGSLALVAENRTAASLMVDPQDWPGVIRAVGDLQADVERVTGVKPGVSSAVPARADNVVIAGTIGRSALIERLVRARKLNVDAIRGKWESFVSEVVESPLPGVARALVIAGSDKRGTIYGIYDLSEQIGVSPWYWWADVVPEHRDALFVAAGRRVAGEPGVKYRGIFLNDEAPDLTNWVRAKFGDAPVSENPPVPAGIANYGHAFYARLFEVILRLRGNYLWPAMWNNAFNEDDPDNARLADDYGVVMGTSHQEPMLRAQKEWDRRYQRTLGSWNYAKHPEVLEQFWREGIRRNKNYESLVTIGLRGANDTPMAPGGPEANRALLEHIIDVQRGTLREEVNPDVARVPQLWCLYKEVQDFYEAGMRAPDDVTLLWAEDNWGNIRRLPTPEERKRPGGAGVYYHFDYHGGPRSYQWLNTSPLPKIWDQMTLAKTYGADRVWIVNVGHFKGYEVPTEFFINLGWQPQRWRGDDVNEFLRLWAAREFGRADANEIADIVAGYTKLNGRRKPELLAPNTYSLTSYDEAERAMAEFDALAARAELVGTRVRPEQRDAFFGLVAFPTMASALVNRLYVAAGRNALYAAQGREIANDYAAETRSLFERYQAMVAEYHQRYAGGKWDHFMDQPVLGYTSWRDPPKNNLDHIKLISVKPADAPEIGVAVEGATQASRASAVVPLKLPAFDAINQQRRWIDVFNCAVKPAPFTLTPSAPWIVLSSHGSDFADERIWVTIDWRRAPAGRANGSITVTGAGATFEVGVEAFTPAGVTRESVRGFVENAGVIAIEPEHFAANVAAGAKHWARIADYGRTLSGMRAELPVDAPAGAPGKDSPRLEYPLRTFSAGDITVTAITAPTLNFIPDRPVRYAVSIDEDTPQIVTLVPQGYRAQNGNRAWEKSVSDNAHYGSSHHRLATAGPHTLKLWAVDPAVVLQKIIVDLGGLRPSYLGPPESFRGGAVAKTAERAKP